jgi:hypothetical protein
LLLGRILGKNRTGKNSGGAFMPKCDGTGLQGLGPMTGNGQGYCLIAMPDAHNDARTGFVGLAGKPVSIFNHSHQIDVQLLQNKRHRVQMALQKFKLRLEKVEAKYEFASNSVKTIIRGLFFQKNEWVVSQP